MAAIIGRSMRAGVQRGLTADDRTIERAFIADLARPVAISPPVPERVDGGIPDVAISGSAARYRCACALVTSSDPCVTLG